MEWYEVFGKVLPVVFWVIPAILLIALAAFILLAPAAFLAGAGLRLYDVVGGVVRRRTSNGMQLGADVPGASEGATALVGRPGQARVATVDVLPGTRTTKVSGVAEVETEEPEAARVSKCQEPSGNSHGSPDSRPLENRR